MFLPRFGLTTFVVGTLLTALVPASSWAQNHQGRSSGGRSFSSGRSGGWQSRSAQGFSGASRNNGGQSFSRGSQSYRAQPYGGQSFSRGGGYRGYSGGGSYRGRGYVAPRYYTRPRGRYYGGSSLYFGFGAPYGYAYGPGYYDPGYAYAYPSYSFDPGYTYGPDPCSDGSYDAYGNWVPDPNCYQPPQNYNNSNPRPYPPNQPSYNNPNNQNYPPPNQPAPQYYPQR
jgi:hypothetical protein